MIDFCNYTNTPLEGENTMVKEKWNDCQFSMDEQYRHPSSLWQGTVLRVTSKEVEMTLEEVLDRFEPCDIVMNKIDLQKITMGNKKPQEGCRVQCVFYDENNNIEFTFLRSCQDNFPFSEEEEERQKRNFFQLFAE